ncbi:MAG: sugar O-acetyltransferase [Pyrinomonadaceae bacterium]|nr:sugar O-acetyltransferase [Sphingobacteriaceae bacterium]
MRSELEKMLSGELYTAADPELVGLRLKARRLFTSFNQTPYDDLLLKNQILSALLGNIKGNLDIQAPFYCDYGVNIFVGENVFMNFNCVILDCAKVVLGDNVFLAPNVQLYTAYHPIEALERIKGPELAAPITIGNNVWIGGSAIICPGVSIGENTTIGTGSVVTKNIPSNVVAAGNPCKIIRSLDPAK